MASVITSESARDAGPSCLLLSLLPHRRRQACAIVYAVQLHKAAGQSCFANDVRRCPQIGGVWLLRSQATRLELGRALQLRLRR